MTTQIDYFPLPEASMAHLSRLPDQGAAYLWADAQALQVYRWYMNQRIVKSRTSRGLRVVAIGFGSLGALIPFVALATKGFLSANWGFVALAVTAAVMLTDRALGFSASWIRYTRAALDIQLSIVGCRSELLAVLADGKTTTAAVHELATRLATGLVTDVQAVVREETAEWVADFRVSNDELRGALSPVARP